MKKYFFVIVYIIRNDQKQIGLRFGWVFYVPGVHNSRPIKLAAGG